MTSQGSTDDQLALLSSICGSDLEACRTALVNAGGDPNLAAQLLLSNDPMEVDGLLRGVCSECGASNVPGYFGQGSYAETFFCRSCWNRWDGVLPDASQSMQNPLDDLEQQEDMLQRDIGLIQASSLEELGQALVRRLDEKWRSPLKRTGDHFAWDAKGKDSWSRVARAAAAAVEAAGQAGEGMETAMKFLFGAAQVAQAAGEDLWKLLTIYEVQVSSQLPRRQNPARAAGCTGVACASGILGQTEEVDVYIYDYGKLDVVARLRSSGMPAAALLYDPACTMCPIGIGASGLCVSRFTLYPRTEAVGVGGLPLAAVLWELFLGPRNLPEAIACLKGFLEKGRRMASGAALLLTQPGHGMVMVEWSRTRIHISPVGLEGILVHANHCAFGSSLQDDDHQGISRLLDESKRRQSSIEDLYAEELLAGRPSLGLSQVQAFLSAKCVQNDEVLATVISCPETRELYIRFRLQVSGMGMVEDTVACDFWQCFE